MGTLRSDDGDGNANEVVKKAIGLITKTTILYVHVAFFLHFLAVTARLPHENVYRGSTQATTKFPLFFWTWIWFLGIQLKEGSPTFNKVCDFK